MENQEPKMISLPTVSVDVFNVIMAGLGKLPVEVAGDLFQAFKQLANEQLAPKAEEAPAE